MTEVRHRSKAALLSAVICFGVLLPIGAGYLLRQLDIVFNPSVWGSLQVISGFLGLSLAANVLVRFLGTGDRASLIFGTGFGVCGIIQMGGILELVFRFMTPTKAPQTSDSLLSWMVGQTLLALLLFVTVRAEKWLPWPREPKRVVFAVIAVVATATYLIAVSYLAWPEEWTVRGNGIMPRPVELIPASLFCAATVVLNPSVRRNRSVFEAMLAWVAAMSAACHLVASESVSVLDAPAMAAQVLSTGSFALLLGATLLDNVRLFREVQSHATSDSLTGLANYRRLLEAVQGELERSGRTERPFSVLLMDLDGLKEINDRHGHVTGSRALCRVADVLREHRHSLDTAARYGGDEFALVLPETDENAARQVSARIRKNLEAQIEAPRLSVSVGAATYPQNGASVQQLLDAADRELYAMKARSGKSRGWRQLPLEL